MAKRKRIRPVKSGSDYRKMWRIVDGAVRDAFQQHPEYLWNVGGRNARQSIVKRVTGAVLGHAAQAARGRSGEHSGG